MENIVPIVLILAGIGEFILTPFVLKPELRKRQLNLDSGATVEQRQQLQRQIDALEMVQTASRIFGVILICIGIYLYKGNG